MRAELEDDVMRTKFAYEQSKGWFWQCDSVCQSNKAEYDAVMLQYNGLLNEESLHWSDAKAAVGVFSTMGVGETRTLFWQRFGQGKDFAKRQTTWDALFIGLRMGRDEGLGSYVLRLIMNMLINFTIGLFGAVVTFMWGLWSLIVEYQTSLIVGLFYFAMCALAVSSFALTWLFGLYVGTAGTVFVGARLLANNARLEGQNQQRPHLQ